jgi:hypothetical protein
MRSSTSPRVRHAAVCVARGRPRRGRRCLCHVSLSDPFRKVGIVLLPPPANARVRRNAGPRRATLRDRPLSPRCRWLGGGHRAGSPPVVGRGPGARLEQLRSACDAAAGMSVDGNPAFGAAVLVRGVGRWPEGGGHRVGDGEGVVHAVVDTFSKSSPVVAMVLVTWAQPHESEPRTSGASSFAVAYSEALIENDRVAVAGTKRSGPVSTPSMRRRISCNGSASVSARAVGGECAAVRTNSRSSNSLRSRASDPLLVDRLRFSRPRRSRRARRARRRGRRASSSLGGGGVAAEAGAVRGVGSYVVGAGSTRPEGLETRRYAARRLRPLIR